MDAAIELLDSSGEEGLTFRLLSERLVTGPGAIYWHVANKTELLIAACDLVVARTLEKHLTGKTPKVRLRALALGLFDTLDEHPWMGLVLLRAELQSPMVRVVEKIGQQVISMGVPVEQHWSTVGALVSYIVGVGGQNAANGQYARTHGLDRQDFLEKAATAWSQLDLEAYPFVRSVAGTLRIHDDRADFLAGFDLILRAVELLA